MVSQKTDLSSIELTLDKEHGAEIYRSAKRKLLRQGSYHSMNEEEEAIIAELEQSLHNLREQVGGLSEDLNNANTLMHSILMQRINFVKLLTEEFNARKFASCLQFVKQTRCCEQVELIHPNLGGQVQGHEALAKDLEQMLGSFPDLQFKMCSAEPVQGCGQQLKIRYEVQSGPNMKPFGGVAALKRSVTTHIYLNITFKGLTLETASVVWSCNAAEIILSLMGLKPHTTPGDRI